MDFSHEFFVAMAKSFGLFWLIGMSIGITAYAFWPSLGKRFDKAANSILDDEDGPDQRNQPNTEDRLCR